MSNKNPGTNSEQSSPITLKDPQAIDLLARIQQAREHTAALQQLWLALEICKDSCVPANPQFVMWLTRYGFDTVEAAINATAVWLNKLRTGSATKLVMHNRTEAADRKANEITHNEKVKYASGVMRKMAGGDE